MAKNRRSVLGIEFHAEEIRLVEMRRSGMAPVVGSVHRQALSPGSVEGGVVRRPELVAEALGRAFEKMGASTRDAVIGLPSQAVTMRVLDVPPVTENEMRFVVEGELKHFDILREEGGTFDFIKLKSPSQGSGGDSQILLMAVEESIINGYREALTRANVQIDALEPAHMALYRAAVPMLKGLASVMFVAVSDASTEIAFLIGNEFCLYRRVDTGSRELISTSTSTGVSEVPASSLATEIRRSLDYFHRQYPNSTAITKLIVSVNEAGLAKLPEWLAANLKMDVELAQQSSASAATPALAAQLDPPEGLQYVGAIGLALRGLGVVPGAPEFDLTHSSGSSNQTKAARRTLTGALVASAAIALLLGGLGAFFAVKVGDKTRELDSKKAELAGLNRELGSNDRILRLSLLRSLSREGVPFPRVMDEVAIALDPSAGLTQLTLGPDNRLHISGEATSEASVINTMERLRMTSFFTNTLIESFDKGVGGSREGFRFDISTQYVPIEGMGTAPVGAPGTSPGGLQ